MRAYFFLACLINLTVVALASKGDISQLNPAYSERYGANLAEFNLPDGKGKGFVLMPTNQQKDSLKPWILYAPTYIEKNPHHERSL